MSDGVMILGSCTNDLSDTADLSDTNNLSDALANALLDNGVGLEVTS